MQPWWGRGQCVSTSLACRTDQLSCTPNHRFYSPDWARTFVDDAKIHSTRTSRLARSQHKLSWQYPPCCDNLARWTIDVCICIPAIDSRMSLHARPVPKLSATTTSSCRSCCESELHLARPRLECSAAVWSQDRRLEKEVSLGRQQLILVCRGDPTAFTCALTTIPGFTPSRHHTSGIHACTVCKLQRRRRCRRSP